MVNRFVAKVTYSPFEVGLISGSAAYFGHDRSPLISRPAQARIEYIAQPVAEQVESQGGYRDGNPRINSNPGINIEEFTAVSKHIAPTWYGWRHA